tara:strand:- start:11643 stop:12407 length:765 start_codon:yes stop_codon:yes gene_type:complete
VIKVLKIIGHVVLVVGLTAISQLGGLAWLLARLVPKYKFPAFLGVYALLSVAAIFIAPMTGRVPLSCLPVGELQVHSPFYCALNRHYVAPELKVTLEDAARQVRARHPDTVTQVLDAGFPFLNGFPLLPHLSHEDGRKADIAFYYADENGDYLAGKTRSPMGYFAFEEGETVCPQAFPTLRWDLAFLQGAWPNYRLEKERMVTLLSTLTDDDRVGKIFLEPYIVTELGLQNDKLRFQGCRAARHDDHIHVQLND